MAKPIQLSKVERRGNRWIRLETGEPVSDEDLNTIYWSQTVLRESNAVLDPSMTEWVTLIDNGLLKEFIEYAIREHPYRRHCAGLTNNDVQNLFDFTLARWEANDPKWKEYEKARLLECRVYQPYELDSITPEAAQKYREYELRAFQQWKWRRLIEKQQLSAVERAKQRWKTDDH